MMKETTRVFGDFIGGSLLFSGSMEEVVDWLTKNISSDMVYVSVELNTGSRVPVKEFLEGVQVTEDVRIHARNAMVLQLVISAMNAQADATHYGSIDFGTDLVAKETAEKIIKLFEEGKR